jgi:hypothetical protein
MPELSLGPAHGHRRHDIDNTDSYIALRARLHPAARIGIPQPSPDIAVNQQRPQPSRGAHRQCPMPD